MNVSFKKIFLSLFTVSCAFSSCKDSATGPNDLGGDTNVDFAVVGSTFDGAISMDAYFPEFSRLNDSTVVTKNDNGIVTAHTKATFDSSFVVALDSALGTKSFPDSLKHAVVDKYLTKFNATLDSSDKQHIQLEFDLKLKVTSEGIQEFVNGKGDLSKPFTIVKYGAAVGDTYTFTTSDGQHITRTVTYKSTTDDYPFGFWLFKVIKVEQTSDDPVIDKITFVTNHKYGLIGVLIRFKTGKELRLGIAPSTM